MAKFVTAIILGLASLQTAMAAPKVYPEVIPGPGLPSLESLNLTSAQLYEMGTPSALLARSQAFSRSAAFNAECGPADAAYTDVNDIIACFHYLQNLGTTNCAVGANDVVVEMCRAGSAHVQGQAITGNPESSYCSDVALAVLWVINDCTRPDQSCAGFQAANGNGNLIIGATNVIW